MHAINFSNGMALVPSINGESKNLHAIDKNGNLLFTLDNYETAHDDNSFTNGLIYIYNLEEKCTNLMDDTGKITTPADVGGTHFEFYSDQFWKDMFDDGYIIVKKVVSDFQGATYKAAILDTSLNVIVDYSQEVYSLIYNPTIEKTYLNGYLISDTYENRETICNVFDIQSNQLKKYTSAELEAFTDELIQSMNLMDYVKYGFINVDELGEILGLNQYPTLYKLSCINSNLFLAVFSETMGMGECYFTLVDESGTLKFDPINYGTYDYFSPGMGIGSKILAIDNYVVTIDSIDKTYDEGAFAEMTGSLSTVTYRITVYDTNGKKINSTDYIRYVDELYAEDFYFSINDEAIIVADHDQITYYDLNLNIMCEN